MKSKTSESLIASESKTGITRDGADEHKQKQKKGKGTDGTGRKNRRIVSSKRSFYSVVACLDDVNNPLFYVGQHPSVILQDDKLRFAAIDFR